MSLSKLAVVFCLASAMAFAQSSGTIAGFVLDGQTGRPVAGATYSVNGQKSDSNVTNSEGRFTYAAPPGTYKIQFSAANYHDVELTEIVVVAGQTAEASTVMSNLSFGTSIDVVESATAIGATAEAMLIEQKLSPVVSDGLSHQEMSASASSDAAGALQKVAGVSVVGEGFVYVRGLGERYSAAQMNGALLATTEPEKRVVPLDLFPSSLIENIRILKTYSPDLPAEFAGGLVQMQTIDFPSKPIFTLSTKSGFNTMTTFDNFSTYPGGSHDFFGFDDGTRSIPSIIPKNKRLFAGSFTQAQLQDFGKSFSDNWEPVLNNSARPAFDWSAVAGNTFGRLGIIGAVTFGNKNQFQSELQRYIRQGADAPIIFTEYPDFREYSETAKLGAVLNASIRLSPSHSIRFRNTLTHDTEKTAREFAGYDGGVDSDIKSQRLRWVERQLFTTGAEGDHSFPRLGNSLIHWQFNYSTSSRDEPDLREVIRGKLPDGRYIFTASGSSGIRFFSNLTDRIYEPQLDYSIPITHGSLSALFKTGFRATVRSRDFSARRFLFSPQQLSTIDRFAPSNQLFGPDNIRPSGFQITEFTRGTDTYSAEMNIYAGYSMVDLAIGPRWRFTGGVRFESSKQEVTTIDNLVPNAKPVKAALENTDPAPALNVIYSLTSRQNLRFSFSRTLSRPDFRELSPFDFNNVLGGYVTQGNADLKRATIMNYDARWEWFQGGNQMIAASFFAKSFNNPIEQTIIPSNDLRQTFVNAQGARNMGFELEIRKSLVAFSQRLHDFGVSGNFTFVDSNIDIRPDDATIVTSRSRALLGQSKYLANGIVEWNRPKWHSDARFYVNYSSRRISDVGTFGVPDVYQEGNTILDVVYQYNVDEKGKWNVRFEAENLGDNDYRWTQGKFTQRDYRSGRTFQIGLSYSFF